jgi:flagellar basal-body rod protein FlgB
MEILQTPQRVMEASLQVRSARAELLAGNIANADTPGYEARDIKFDKAIDRVLEGGDSANTPTTTINTPENLNYDTNDVDLGQQVAKSYQNSLNYVATLRLYGDSVNRIKSATSSS